MRYISLLTIFLLLFFSGKAQTSKKTSKQLFGGAWVNKKLNRHLTISFEGQDWYATINDWTGKDQGTADAYKAFIKGRKLVMPAETDEHRAPYSEMIISGKKLLFRSRGLFADQNKFVDSIYFVRDFLQIK